MSQNVQSCQHDLLSNERSPEHGHGFSPSPARQAVFGTRNIGQGGDVKGHCRISSVPKFGDWDETDPNSAEEFTIIFDKVKEEKIATANLPTASIEPMIYQGRQRNFGSASSKSKLACCLFPATDD